MLICSGTGACLSATSWGTNADTIFIANNALFGDTGAVFAITDTIPYTSIFDNAINGTNTQIPGMNGYVHILKNFSYLFFRAHILLEDLHKSC